MKSQICFLTTILTKRTTKSTTFSNETKSKYWFYCNNISKIGKILKNFINNLTITIFVWNVNEIESIILIFQTILSLKWKIIFIFDDKMFFAKRNNWIDDFKRIFINSKWYYKKNYKKIFLVLNKYRRIIESVDRFVSIFYRKKVKKKIENDWKFFWCILNFENYYNKLILIWQQILSNLAK